MSRKAGLNQAGRQIWTAPVLATATMADYSMAKVHVLREAGMAKRVLIVDDDEDTRNVYSAMLKYAGYEIVEAPTGEIGLSLAETYQPDVVVLDIGLPGINGWEVCHKLKSMPATAAAKIVIVTAHAFIDESRRAEECGAEALLIKPASPLLVRSYVAELVGPSNLN